MSVLAHQIGAMVHQQLKVTSDVCTGHIESCCVPMQLVTSSKGAVRVRFKASMTDHLADALSYGTKATCRWLTVDSSSWVPNTEGGGRSKGVLRLQTYEDFEKAVEVRFRVGTMPRTLPHLVIHDALNHNHAYHEVHFVVLQLGKQAWLPAEALFFTHPLEDIQDRPHEWLHHHRPVDR